MPEADMSRLIRSPYRRGDDGAAKAQKVAVGVLDGELTKSVRKVLRTRFGVTMPLNSVPQRINVIDRKILRCRRMGRPEVRIFHEHDGNVITAQGTPSILLLARPSAGS